jgi:hypothetical protein
MKIFLSHTSSDKEFAEKLASDLRAAGCDVFTYFDTIAIGDSIAEKIATGILDSDVMILLLSKKSAQSSWVTSEIALARAQIERGKRKYIFPIVIQKDSEIPFFIKDLLYLDLSDNDEYRKNMPLLIKTLRQTEEELLHDKTTSSFVLEKMYKYKEEHNKVKLDELRKEINSISSQLTANKARAEMAHAQEWAMNEEELHHKYTKALHDIFIYQVMRIGAVVALSLGVIAIVLLFYLKITWASIFFALLIFFIGMSVPISILFINLRRIFGLFEGNRRKTHLSKNREESE